MPRIFIVFPSTYIFGIMAPARAKVGRRKMLLIYSGWAVKVWPVLWNH